MPLCPNHPQACQREIGGTESHHAPTCAMKTPLVEWKNMKVKGPIEGEGLVEEVLPGVAPEPGLLGVVQPAVAP
jgi:hypothetical protein